MSIEIGDDDGRQRCGRCGEDVLSVSTDGLCDGCVAQEEADALAARETFEPGPIRSAAYDRTPPTITPGTVGDRAVGARGTLVGERRQTLMGLAVWDGEHWLTGADALVSLAWFEGHHHDDQYADAQDHIRHLRTWLALTS